jgi:hypothetical protein
MRELQQYKGFVLASDSARPGYVIIFTKEEWRMGEGYRYEEHEAGSVTEAREFIDTY